MIKFKKGMICLMEIGIVVKTPDGDKTALLEQGTPVRIIDVVEPACSSMVSGECQAPCKGACCPRSIIVEDCNEKRWTVNLDVEEDDFPLIALDDGDPEMLLSRKDWKKFKVAKWTNEGIESKFKGPLYMMLAALSLSAADAISDPWSFVLTSVCVLIALYGATIFIAGHKYAQHPLPYGQVLFYRDFEKNKEALEALLQKGNSTTRKEDEIRGD